MSAKAFRSRSRWACEPGSSARSTACPRSSGSDDFTLNNLSRQPERNEQSIDGKPFTLLTWHSVLAAVKPGAFSLSVESPLTVRIRTGPQREAMLEDQLGDPFMQHFFGATVKKDIKVTSPPLELTVSTLPAEGRPPDFSGAVGTFKIASDLSSSAAAAGDPLTLRLQVTGSGNFDRVDSSHAGACRTVEDLPTEILVQVQRCARVQGGENLRAAADRVETRSRKRFPG